MSLAYDLPRQRNTDAEAQRALAERVRAARQDTAYQVEATAVITYHDPIVYRFRGQTFCVRRIQGEIAWLGQASEIVFDRMCPRRSTVMEYDTS